MKKNVLFLLILSVNCLAQFQPNVKLKQSTITTFTNIEVGINLINPPCWLPHLEQQPNYVLFSNGNQLELVIAATGSPFCNPLPLDFPPHQFYNIGQLEEGIYDLRVRAVFSNTLFIPFANDGTVIGQINNIQVGISTIPSLSWWSVFVLCALLLLISSRWLNRTAKKLSLLLVFFVSTG